MKKARFSTELVEGHGGVTVVIVPFDPAMVWDAKPVALDDRREGWLVRGTTNRAKFEGWIGLRWGRHFIILDEAQRRAAKVRVGDVVDVVVEPTASATALAIAKEQAKLTTAPRRKKRAR
jgi:hypothetical protein